MPISGRSPSHGRHRSAAQGFTGYRSSLRCAGCGCASGGWAAAVLGVTRVRPARLRVHPAAGIARGSHGSARPVAGVRGLILRAAPAPAVRAQVGGFCLVELASLALGGGGERRPSAELPVHPQQRAGRSPALEQVKKFCPTFLVAPHLTGPVACLLPRCHMAFDAAVIGRMAAGTAPVRPGARWCTWPRAPPRLRPNLRRSNPLHCSHKTLNQPRGRMPHHLETP